MQRLAVALILVMSLAFLGGCKKEEVAAAPEVRPVRTMVVDPKPIDDDRSAVGEIKPRYESDLGFRVAGKMLSRSVDVGMTVKKGDVLARLDVQDFQNRLNSSEADVSSAEAVLVEAKGNEDRQGQLLAKGITTRSSYDSALKNLRAAEAQVTSTKAALALAKDQVAYAELKADFDGIITAVGAEAGQVVTVAQMVVRLAKPQEKDAVFNIAESAFKNRKPDDKPAITVTLLSDPAISAEGIGREVSPVADPTTRTYQVKVTLENPPEAMRFGSSVIGKLKSVTAPVVVLPGSALFDSAGKPAVWLFKENKVTLQPIVVARFETDRVIVSDGLAKGDVVVTAGVNRLREGQAVKLIEGSAQ